MKEVSSADLLCKWRHCIQGQQGEVRLLPPRDGKAGLQWLDQDFPAYEMLLDSSPKCAALPSMLHSTCISAVSSHESLHLQHPRLSRPIEWRWLVTQLRGGREGTALAWGQSPEGCICREEGRSPLVTARGGHGSSPRGDRSTGSPHRLSV